MKIRFALGIGKIVCFTDSETHQMPSLISIGRGLTFPNTQRKRIGIKLIDG